MSDTASTKTVLKRGLTLCCPNCGKGRLLKHYITPNAVCPACGEDFAPLRADDGPAWLTILIVGHIVIPLLLSLQQSGNLESLWVLPAVLVGTIALTLALLPFSKGVFMAALWLNRHKG